MENSPVALLTIGYQPPEADHLQLVGFVLLCRKQYEVVGVPVTVDSDEREVVMGMADTVARTYLDHGLGAATRIFSECSNNLRVTEPVMLPQIGTRCMEEVARRLRHLFGTSTGSDFR